MHHDPNRPQKPVASDTNGSEPHPPSTSGGCCGKHKKSGHGCGGHAHGKDRHHHGEHAHGHSHDHQGDHGHDHVPHAPHHGHGHTHGPGHHDDTAGPVLVLRPSTGISGDIMVAGLARMLDLAQAELDAHIAAIGLPALAAGCLRVEPESRNEVGGWMCRVSLPHEHAHRTLADIRGIIAASTMTEQAKDVAVRAFTVLAEAEGAVHGKASDAVSFHEVGALDSILDTCLAASLFTALAPSRFVCGSLPLCDGEIRCAHGKIPSPAPAVLRLLHNVPVHGIDSQGETVTPTGLALLKAFGAEFGPWPSMVVESEALVYGGRVFPNVPNGAIFACGQSARTNRGCHHAHA